MVQQCPCCERPFKSILDFPLVFVKDVEVLAVPEVVDSASEEAARAWIRQANNPANPRETRPGINRTPEVAVAYEKLQDYFRSLVTYKGQTVAPDKLNPLFAPDRYFRWAYPIPGTDLFVSLRNQETTASDRTCEVEIHGRGPNLGSAGGPTLQPFGPVARITYEGHLVGPCGNSNTRA
jgi:hypothetical protein